MRALVAVPRADGAGPSFLVAAASGVLALAVAAGGQRTPLLAAAAGALVLGAVLVRRPYIRWETILVVLVLVILFIPIRRYTMPGNLPFQLEPYRVLVALVLAGWGAALLADPRVRLSRSGLDGPVTLVLLAVLGSVAANPDRFAATESTALKALTFFLSFVLVFYLVVSVVRTEAAATVVVKTLVAGGAVLAVLAVLEARTGVTPFTRLDAVLPFLTADPSFSSGLGRGGSQRAFGSAEHPIALGAALVMLIPFAVYVARIGSARWYLALVALVVGVLATVSRTGIVMLLVLGVVFLVLRPRETRRLWPLLLPALVATHFAVPGTLGSIKQAFLPEGGLLAQQSATTGDCNADGRIADLGPTLAEVGQKPVLGHGFGTRVVTGEESNACILDNQWLGTLLDLGVVGALAWLWLFLAVLHRLGGAGKHDPSPLGWLAVAVAASVTAYAVAMLTFDAFSFIQVTFLLFIVLGIGAAILRGLEPAPEAPDRRVRTSRALGA